MNYMDMFNTLQKIEKDNDVWSMKIDGIFIWPLIRSKLIQQLLKAEYKSFRSLLFAGFEHTPAHNLKEIFNAAGKLSVAGQRAPGEKYRSAPPPHAIEGNHRGNGPAMHQPGA